MRSWQYQDNAPTLKIGEEMGRFDMGSTIIVLFGKDKAQWDSELTADKVVKLGGRIGNTLAIKPVLKKGVRSNPLRESVDF